MTEKICEVMGWTFTKGIDICDEKFVKVELGLPNDRKILINPDFRISPALADLLENKMVEDGWIVGTEHRPNKFRVLIARYSDDQLIPCVEKDAFATTRPLAITELFCKIYGIPFEEKT
jgi:hypothetical protein